MQGNKKAWQSLKGWEMGPTWEMGFVRNQQATSKLAKFCEEEMRKLMASWEDVINNNGDYVDH
ncbi:hypothetical protein ACTXT7_012640 [Hymenolepis weldensis]